MHMCICVCACMRAEENSIPYCFESLTLADGQVANLCVCVHMCVCVGGGKLRTEF